MKFEDAESLSHFERLCCTGRTRRRNSRTVSGSKSSSRPTALSSLPQRHWHCQLHIQLEPLALAPLPPRERDSSGYYIGPIHAMPDAEKPPLALPIEPKVAADEGLCSIFNSSRSWRRGLLASLTRRHDDQGSSSELFAGSHY